MAVLEIRDVGTIEARPFGEFFLGPAETLALGADGTTESGDQVCRRESG